MDFNFKDLLCFNKMITPVIITIIYWILLVVLVISGIVAVFKVGFFSGLFTLIVGVVGTRIWCELVMFAFKINDNLKQIAQNTSKSESSNLSLDK